MNLTKEQRIDKHKDFLKANWDAIAAFAWEHFLHEGRGAVLVPEEDFVHADAPQLTGIRFNYLATGKHNLPPFNGILSEKELGWLENCDPDARVAVCVLREGGGVSSYFIGGRTKPSEAHAIQAAKQN